MRAKSLISSTITLFFFFLFLSSVCAESPKEVNTTRIVMNTSGPIAYRHLYEHDPPRITFRFFHNTVYSRLQESVPIQKGMVKGMEATYFSPSAPGAKRPLKTLTFYLLAGTRYDIFEGPRSIILVIHHPEKMPSVPLSTGKVMLTTLPSPTSSIGEREEELSEALAKAMIQLSPVAAEVPAISPAAPPEIRSASVAFSQERPAMPPWYQTPFFWYSVVLFFILGGLVWPPSWISIQQRILRWEQRRSWEMAKRIIVLKEEATSIQEGGRKLQEVSQVLLQEKEILTKELERSTADLHELARERIELADRFQNVQTELNEKTTLQEDLLRELRELSARYDQEIAHRRELEAVLEALKQKGETGGTKEEGEEKRRWTRLPILPAGKRDLPLTIEVQGPEGRLIYGYPKNLSLGGVAFELKENVELPDPLSLTLFFPKRKSGLETQGRVIWKVQEGKVSHYGVHFVDLPQNGVALIREFVKERLPQMREAARMIEESVRERSIGKTVTFTLEAPSAQSVSVAGDFNGWDSESHSMKKTKEGLWKLTLSLPPGSYQYQFYVDGIWQVDPAAKVHVPNPFGGENAVIEIS